MKKVFENDLCLKMTRLSQKKKVSASTAFRMIKKMRGKSLRRSMQKPPVEWRGFLEHLLCNGSGAYIWRGAVIVRKYSNGSEEFAEKHLFAEWPGELREWIFRVSDEKTVDQVFNKQDNQVVTFGNYVFEHCWVSTTKHPASILMLDVVASNGEYMLPVWFE